MNSEFHVHVAAGLVIALVGVLVLGVIAKNVGL